MLKVLFFARLKEELDCSQLDLEWSPSLADLDSLRGALVAIKGSSFASSLDRENIICAVNQAVIEGNCELRDGDEVAFFPPVTGG
ncbi:MAG: MoaD/ThiS family protein [Pseudomonadota bacterium]